MDWIAKVGDTYLKKIDAKVEDYCNDLCDLSVPLDQLALLILARTYHRHIGVFTKHGIWSTRYDNSMRDCIMYLVFNGEQDFCDTVSTGYNEYENVTVQPGIKASRRLSPLRWYRPSSSSSSDDDASDSPLSLSKSPSLEDGQESSLLDQPSQSESEISVDQNSPLLGKTPESSLLAQPSESEVNDEQSSHLLDESPSLQTEIAPDSTLLLQPSQSALNDNQNSGDLQVEQETTPVKKPCSLKVKKPVKRKSNTVTVWANKRLKLTRMPSLSRKLKEYIKLQSNLEKKRKKWKIAKQIERKRLRDAKKKHDLKKLSIKLDKVDVAKELEKLKNLSKSYANNNVRKQDSEEELGSRKARPDDLTEPDPLLKSVPSDEVDSILAEDRKKLASSSKVSEVNVTTSDGSITVAKFAIVKRDKKPRDFPCPLYHHVTYSWGVPSTI